MRHTNKSYSNSDEDEDETEGYPKRRVIAMDKETYQALMLHLATNNSDLSFSNLITDATEEVPSNAFRPKVLSKNLPRVERPTILDNYIDFDVTTLDHHWNALSNQQIPPPNTTFRLSLTENNVASSKDTLLSFHATKHLQYSNMRLSFPEFDKILITGVWPLITKADGNCLLYSVSRAIWGLGTEDKFQPVLRSLIVRELTEYTSFYRNAVDTLAHEDKAYSDDEFEEFVRQAAEDKKFLGLIHIFALANIVRRPIILYSNAVDMARWGVHEQGIAGLFLPTRHSPKSVLGPPIGIAWNDQNHDHFVPLIPVDTYPQFQWPLLELVYQRTLQEGEKVEDFIQYDFKAQDTEICLHGLMELERGNFRVERRAEVRRDSNSIHAIPVDFKFTFEYGGQDTSIWINREESPQHVLTRWWVRTTGSMETSQHEAEFIHQLLFSISACIEQGQKQISFWYPTRSCSSPMKICKGKKAYDRFMDLHPKIQTTIETKNRALRNGPESQFTLSPSEDFVFAKLVETLQKHFDERLVIPVATLDIVEKMIHWPKDEVFPVIDILRVLILLPSAAEHFRKQNKGTTLNPHTAIGLIFELFLQDNLRWENCYVCIKLLTNLFYQKCFRDMLLENTSRILKKLQTVTKNQPYEPKFQLIVSKAIPSLLYNYALLWRKRKTKNISDHSKLSSLNLGVCVSLIETFKESDEILLKSLQTIALLLTEDALIPVPPVSVTTNNKQIQDLLNFIATLSRCKIQKKYFLANKF